MVIMKYLHQLNNFNFIIAHISATNLIIIFIIIIIIIIIITIVIMVSFIIVIIKFIINFVFIMKI